MTKHTDKIRRHYAKTLEERKLSLRKELDALETGTWAEIDRLPGYSVSDRGDVLKRETGRILTQSYNRAGSPIVGVASEGRITTQSVARLVAEAFVPMPEGLTAYHVPTPTHHNGDKSDCRAANLSWRTRSFAIQYHKQFSPDFVSYGEVYPGWTITNPATGETLPLDGFAIKHCLLQGVMFTRAAAGEVDPYLGVVLLLNEPQ